MSISSTPKRGFFILDKYMNIDTSKTELRSKMSLAEWTTETTQRVKCMNTT